MARVSIQIKIIAHANAAALTMALIVSSASAQDRPRPIAENPMATVHQFGIIRAGESISENDLLDLPEFVHRSKPDSTTTAPAWLDFSALYFMPPQMTTAPLVFNVRQSLGTAWYPYAGQTKASIRRPSGWKNVYVGMRAEALKTTNSVWMTARDMEAAATLKVYKPGPAGSKPDDEGTTEGEVFIFMRGRAIGRDPIRAKYDSASDEWILHIFSIWSDVQFPFTASTRHAWIARNVSDKAEIYSRRITLEPGGAPFNPIRTSATVKVEPYSRDSMDLRVQLKEAIVGNGLPPAEATAQTKLILRSVARVDGPVLIYMLGPEWINARFPLKIEGPAKKPVRVFMVVLELPEVG